MKLVKEPIYYQLTNRLKELIESGSFPQNTKFLTEREIAQRFEVSRATANKALANLVSQGVLEFKKGIGTFVKEPTLVNELSSLVSFTGRAKQSGFAPHTDLLNWNILSELSAEMLFFPQEINRENLMGYYMKRLRKADGDPVILEERQLYLPKNTELTEKDMTSSLYHHLTEKLGYSITHVDQQIQAVPLTEEQAELLNVPPHFPALLITASAYRSGDKLLWQEKTLYRSDKYAFSNRLDNHHRGGSLINL